LSKRQTFKVLPSTSERHYGGPDGKKCPQGGRKKKFPSQNLEKQKKFQKKRSRGPEKKISP